MYPDPYHSNSGYYEPPAPVEPPPGPSLFRRFLHFTREVLETIVPAVLIALLINLFLAQATRVYGQSMEPNLHTDQRLIVEKVSYNRYLRQIFGFDGPKRGDVVVISMEDQGGELLIKRIIGLPGDTIEIHDSQVFVNNVPLTEPYLSDITNGRYGPMEVPPLHIFVLGDNRSYSNDSRNFGTIPIDDIVGRAWFSYWPPNLVGFVN